MEFLVHMEVEDLPAGEQGKKLLALESDRARELAVRGVLRRLWRIPGRRANWGIWIVGSIDELHETISSLPLFPYLNVTVHPLARHPNDPNLPLEK
jgi:muconolactone D-isomerase